MPGTSETHSADPARPAGQPNPRSSPLTFNPLLERPDALAPDPARGSLRVWPSRIEYHVQAALDSSALFRGDDLLAAGSFLRVIPGGATVTAATLNFQVTQTRLPVTVELRLPSTVIIRASAAIAALIWDWLDAAGFILSKLTVILALARFSIFDFRFSIF